MYIQSIEIDKIFRELLNRSVDSNGLNFYKKKSEQFIRKSILNSQEYKFAHNKSTKNIESFIPSSRILYIIENSIKCGYEQRVNQIQNIFNAECVYISNDLEEYISNTKPHTIITTNINRLSVDNIKILKSNNVKIIYDIHDIYEVKDYFLTFLKENIQLYETNPTIINTDCLDSSFMESFIKKKYLIKLNTDTYQMADEIICINKVDVDIFHKYNITNTNLINYENPQKHISLKCIGKKYRKKIIFIGSNGISNIHGWLYFLKNINTKLNNIKINVYGTICNVEFPYASNIIYHGYIDDLSSIYSNSLCSICPLLLNTGINIKVIESIKYNVPVICMKHITDGCNLIHMYNSIICSNSNEFSRAIQDMDDRKISINISPVFIHFIWIGSKCSKNLLDNVIKWQKMNKNYTVLLWVDHMFECNTVRIKNVSKLKLNKQSISKIDTDVDNAFAVRADILRYEILYRYGGFYIDIDCQPKQSLNIIEEAKYDLIGVYECNKSSNFSNKSSIIKFNSICNEFKQYYECFHDPWLNNNFIYCKKSSKCMHDLIQLIKEYGKKYEKIYWFHTGPPVFTNIFMNYINLSSYKTKILDSSFIQPFHTSGLFASETFQRQSICVHNWSSSTLIDTELEENTINICYFIYPRKFDENVGKLVWEMPKEEKNTISYIFLSNKYKHYANYLEYHIKQNNEEKYYSKYFTCYYTKSYLTKIIIINEDIVKNEIHSDTDIDDIFNEIIFSNIHSEQFFVKDIFHSDKKGQYITHDKKQNIINICLNILSINIQIFKDIMYSIPIRRENLIKFENIHIKNFPYMMYYSSMKLNDTKYSIYRYENTNRFHLNKSKTLNLLKYTSKDSCSNRILNIYKRHFSTEKTYEDYKLFQYKNRPYIFVHAYTRQTNKTYVFPEIYDIHNNKYMKIVLVNQIYNTVEKNWICFEHNNNLYCLYNSYPYILYELYKENDNEFIFVKILNIDLVFPHFRINEHLPICLSGNMVTVPNDMLMCCVHTSCYWSYSFYSMLLCNNTLKPVYISQTPIIQGNLTGFNSIVYVTHIKCKNDKLTFYINIDDKQIQKCNLFYSDMKWIKIE